MLTRSWEHRGARISALEWDPSSQCLVAGDIRGKVVCIDVNASANPNPSQIATAAASAAAAAAASLIGGMLSSLANRPSSDVATQSPTLDAALAEVLFIAETSVTQLDFAPPSFQHAPQRKSGRLLISTLRRCIVVDIFADAGAVAVQVLQ